MNLLRYLQGERRGMGSELRRPEPSDERFLDVLYPTAPKIAIQTAVQLADVSFWQDVIDFEVMRNAGLKGLIIRAGQRNWADSKFSTNWQKAKQAGIPRGSYWFYDSRETPQKQAELWASLLDGDPGELVHACDFEESYGGAYGSKAHLKEFINRFQDLTGFPDLRIANYTGFFWWLERVGNDPFFKRYDLWLAWYSAMANVRVPAPWSETDLLLWQYTSSGNGTTYGVSSREIDLNWFYGSETEYKQRFGLGNFPPSGGNVIEEKYFKVVVGGINVRSTPEYKADGSNDIGDVVRDDILHTTEYVDGGGSRWRLTDGKVFRGGIWANFPTPSPTGKYWVAERGTNVYMAETTNPTPQVPVKVPFTLAVTGYKPFNGELEKENG